MDEPKKRYLLHGNTLFIYLSPLVCVGLLAAMLHLTNPLEAGPVSILAVFILLYLLSLSVLCAALHGVGSVLRMVRPNKAYSLRRGYYVMSVVSLAPVLLVALNTLGQLELLELVLIFLLVGLGSFYVLRRSAK